MRLRIILLVLAISSLILVSFLVPLALLLRTFVADRAGSTATAQAQWMAPLVPSGVVVGVQEPGAGGVGGPLVDETRVWDVVPDAFVTCDEVAAASLGHQARSHPSATVATTSCP